MRYTTAFSLKKYPFIRLLLALTAGILMQWYIQFELNMLLIVMIAVLSALSIFYLLSIAKKYVLLHLHGLFILLLFILLGAVLTYIKDGRHQWHWYGKYYEPSSSFRITLQEPLEEKTNSYKALASVNAVQKDGKWIHTTGNILVYFKKDSLPAQLSYGSGLLLQKQIQEIKNSGNPGAFDYNRYCLFQNITGQVYLKNDEYIMLAKEETNIVQELIYNARRVTVQTLQQYIAGKNEQGVAEALLIGYRHDLDKDLVQAYSNTGVVHIIAISGLHLGMIYGLLVGVFSFFKRYRFARWVKPMIILFVLWAFALVAGAAPSIIRSAVMFTFIVIAQTINRKTNMYNTLAAAAFCMLVYNPFILWDVGFLLSYAAVISIVSFMQPVYRWFYFKHVIPDKIWALTAVTISAQVFTIPLVLFYFHQFPNFFLITNFIAVPLSGIILYAEILLLCIAPFEGFAKWIGMVVEKLIYGMNAFIEKMNAVPYSVLENIQLSIFQAWMLYGVIAFLCMWLLLRSVKAFVFALSFSALLSVSLSLDFIQVKKQHRLIVYNVPKHTAIDIVQGGAYTFIGDSVLLDDSFLRNFHLKPGRILHRALPAAVRYTAQEEIKCFKADSTSIVLLEKGLSRITANPKIPVDVLIISKNPRIYISQLLEIFEIRQLVIDSSNPLWKTELWKKDCENLHLRFHSTAQQGAFVMDL